MVASFNSLTEHMRELRAKPTGKLRVQMLPGFAIGHFGRMLAEFTRLYPEQEPTFRLPKLRPTATVYLYCVKDGLFAYRGVSLAPRV